MPVMLSDGLLGRWVVLRYRRDVADGRPPLSDLVGELVQLSPDAATVRTRAGELRTVPRSAVLIAKPVAASRREVLELARISRLGWRAAEQAEFGGWLLCADRAGPAGPTRCCRCVPRTGRWTSCWTRRGTTTPSAGCRC